MVAYEVNETMEKIQVELDEAKTLPSTAEMLSELETDPLRCLSWL